MDSPHKIETGAWLEKEFLVEEQHTAPHVGSGSVAVLATPSMIAFMEITARELLDQFLPDTHSTVGTHVDIYHLAPAAQGKTVRAEAQVEGVEGNKVHLTVAVWEGETQVGKGTHERFVIEIDRFLVRIGGQL